MLSEADKIQRYPSCFLLEEVFSGVTRLTNYEKKTKSLGKAASILDSNMV